MKVISEKIQNPGVVLGENSHLLARKVGSGEVGILIGYEVEDDPKKVKHTTNAIYWNSTEDAIADLEAVIAYFKSPEDEA